MALNSRLSIPGNWQGASIQRMEFNTYIWSCRNQSYSHIRMGTHIWHRTNQSSHHDRMDQPLYLTMEGTNPLTMSKRHSTYTSLPLGRNLDLENTKLLLEVLKLHPSQWFSQHISYLFIYRNILELDCSSLHHIPDIVILDLDMLWLVMEHRVLQQLHTTLVVAIYTSSI